jgi:DNA polymerase I
VTASDLAPILLALAQFEELWVADFEYVSKPGHRPDVVCLVARELRSGQTIRLWRDQMGVAAPYRTDARALFICFTATAECTSHLSLGWPVPANVLDLSPLFRCVVNGRAVPQGKGLLGALAYYGLPAVSAKYKDAMRARILQGPPYTAEEREKILTYCEGDVTETVDLLPKLLQEPDFDLGVALHWGEFVAVSALMEHRGVPLDMEIVPQLQDERAWAFARDAVVPRIDARYGVYTQDLAGEWHFSAKKFEALRARLGIDWPRLESGNLDLRRKTFEGMCKAYPELEALRQLRYARDKMRKVKLAVGPDGRNRTTLWAFTSKTSRTQPKASQWVFSPAVWMRSLIKPGPGRAIAYVDWSSMEFLVAAVLAMCRPMLDLYATGSPYIEFAKRFDAAPPAATKKSHPEVHEVYKTVLLGAQYVMQHVTLAQRLGISTFAAHEMLNQHRGLFNQYWAWSEDWVAHSLDTGVMRTPMGWACRTGITEFNARSIANWPVQATSADIMRLACIMCARAGIGLIGCVHDALVVESSIENIDADVARTREFMRRASRIILNSDPSGTYELRTDATIVRYPDRYVDKRGVAMWTEVMDLLRQYREQEREREAAGKVRKPA